MSKVFIDTFDCKTPSRIFTGKDALKHALFWIENGYVTDEANDLYKYTFELNTAVSWHSGVDRNPARREYAGTGVHAKVYESESHLVYSSQNNVSSPLFEFAIVFEKHPRHLKFFRKTVKRIIAFRTWWKSNK